MGRGGTTFAGGRERVRVERGAIAGERESGCECDVVSGGATGERGRATCAQGRERLVPRGGLTLAGERERVGLSVAQIREGNGDDFRREIGRAKPRDHVQRSHW